MITGIVIAVLGGAVPAAYLLGRRRANQRAVDTIVARELSPRDDTDDVGYFTALRKENSRDVHQ